MSGLDTVIGGKAGNPEAVKKHLDAAARFEKDRNREAAITEREADVDRREQALADAEAVLGDAQARADRELERIGGMTRDEARAQILARVEEATRHDAAQLARRIEEEARQDGERRARSIVGTAIQRTASGYAAATTVSTVALRSLYAPEAEP